MLFFKKDIVNNRKNKKRASYQLVKNGTTSFSAKGGEKEVGEALRYVLNVVNGASSLLPIILLEKKNNHDFIMKVENNKEDISFIKKTELLIEDLVSVGEKLSTTKDKVWWFESFFYDFQRLEEKKEDTFIQNMKEGKIQANSSIYLINRLLEEKRGVCQAYADLFSIYLDSLNVLNVKTIVNFHTWNLYFDKENQKWHAIDIYYKNKGGQVDIKQANDAISIKYYDGK